jgi:pyridinium-3,5-biscarboxylic acid mononucleotide synthase
MTTASEFKLDFLRKQRIGLPEAVYCQGKEPDQIDAILAAAFAVDHSLLLTRLDFAKHEALAQAHRERLDYDPRSRTAFFLAPAQEHGTERDIVIVTAGTSDAGVALEASRTLTFLGRRHTVIHDVGVAGLWRLLERVEELAAARAVICVAGMEAALPSVVAGLVPGLVVAVPTSTGYGVAAGGTAALHAALTACSAGVVVTNIDNGFGAACAVLRALQP